MAMARKPKPLVLGRTGVYFAECQTEDDRPGRAEIVVRMSLVNGSEARRLAAWLVQAAEWIEGRGNE